MRYASKVSRQAQKDFKNIWKYTFENWSLKQADKYYQSIIMESQTICKYPEIGRAIEEVKPNHKIRQFQSHIIAYKIKQDKIWMDRVLHKLIEIDAKSNP